MSALMAVNHRPTTLLGYIKLNFLMVKLNVLSAMEYRINFFSQVIGMVVNDFGLLAVWIIFFSQIPEVRGWAFQDTAIMFAVSTLNFGLVMVFLGGCEHMAKNITEGKLDYFLALPKNALWHISASRTFIAAIGDIIFGIGVFAFAGGPTLERSLLFALVSIISAWIFYNLVVIYQSLGFFTGNFDEAADRIVWILTSLTHYPYTAFSGGLKFLGMTILPAFFVAWLPVSIIKDFSFVHILWLLVFAILSFFLALLIFRYGLRRYESGNLINIRV